MNTLCHMTVESYQTRYSGGLISDGIELAQLVEHALHADRKLWKIYAELPPPLQEAIRLGFQTELRRMLRFAKKNGVRIWLNYRDDDGQHLFQPTSSMPLYRVRAVGQALRRRGATLTREGQALIKVCNEAEAAGLSIETRWAEAEAALGITAA